MNMIASRFAERLNSAFSEQGAETKAEVLLGTVSFQLDGRAYSYPCNLRVRLGTLAFYFNVGGEISPISFPVSRTEHDDPKVAREKLLKTVAEIALWQFQRAAEGVKFTFRAPEPKRPPVLKSRFK